MFPEPSKDPFKELSVHVNKSSKMLSLSSRSFPFLSEYFNERFSVFFKNKTKTLLLNDDVHIFFLRQNSIMFIAIVL